MLSPCCRRPLPRRAHSIAPPPCLLLPYGPAHHCPVGWPILSHERYARPLGPAPKALRRLPRGPGEDTRAGAERVVNRPVNGEATGKVMWSPRWIAPQPYHREAVEYVYLP